ncbi:MAG: hypothetical protein ACK56I_27745, partial [bacterium]
LRRGDIRGGPHGLEPHPRAGVRRCLAHEVERFGNAVHDLREHPQARRPRPRVGRSEHGLRERHVHDVEVPQHPQGLETAMLVVGRLRVLGGQPGAHRRHHFRVRPAGKGDPGPVADANRRVGEQRDDVGRRLPADRHGLLDRLVSHHHAIHAAVEAVAIGIAEIVLHVPDDRVLPIGEVQGAVGAHLQVGGPEERSARRHDRLHLDRLREGLRRRVRDWLERV